MWSRVSNAALRSNSTSSRPRRESTACIRSSCIRTSAVSVLCLGRYALWNVVTVDVKIVLFAEFSYMPYLLGDIETHFKTNLSHRNPKF